jgi:hypothetical protein
MFIEIYLLRCCAEGPGTRKQLSFAMSEYLLVIFILDNK